MRLRYAFFALALALCLPTATSAAEQTWLAYVLGEHVGRWDVIGDGPAYKETLNIVQAQEKGRTTVIESFALQPEGAGLRWEHYVHAGPIDRRERGTIGDGRLWRENTEGQPVASIRAPDGMLLPSMRAERIRVFAAEPLDAAGELPPAPAGAWRSGGEVDVVGGEPDIAERTHGRDHPFVGKFDHEGGATRTTLTPVEARAELGGCVGRDRAACGFPEHFGFEESHGGLSHQLEAGLSSRRKFVDAS